MALRELLICLLLECCILHLVLAELSGDETVTCYKSASDCSNDNGNQTLTADACCSAANSATAYISYLNQCHRCLKIGFNATSLHYNASNIGHTEQLVVSVQYETKSGDKDLDTEAKIIIGPDRVLNAGNYLRKGTEEVQKGIADDLPYTIDIEVARGNQVGLSPALEFNYTLKLHDDGFLPGEPVVLVFGRTSVRVEDLDVVTVELNITQEPLPAEDSVVTAKITRNEIGIEGSFDVTVTASALPDRAPIHPDHQRALPDGPYQDFKSGETQIATFTDQKKSETLQFTLIHPDGIVELTEVFQLTMSISDISGLVIKGDATKIAEFTSIEIFNIGFMETSLRIHEGEDIELVVGDKDVIKLKGGLQVGGFPEDRLVPAIITAEQTSSGGSIVDVDFTFNATLPEFTYNKNNTLNNITFYPVLSLNDDFVEGDETVLIKLSTSPDSQNIQIKDEQTQTATITIVDTTEANLTMEFSDYIVYENASTVEVCAVLIGAKAGIDIRIEFELIPDTATLTNDYERPKRVVFNIEANMSRHCRNIDIVQDGLVEGDEKFQIKLLLNKLAPPELRTNVYVDDRPSTVTIMDDDIPIIRFDRSAAHFYESGGNQSIYVILDDTNVTLIKPASAEVYIDGGVSLGYVTFTSTSQNESVTFPITDDNIALEPNQIRKLKFRNVDSALKVNQLHSTMDITVEDDDVVEVSFDKSKYTYNENHGTVNMNLKLNKPIAQNLTVAIKGGPGTQPSTVVPSGIALDVSATFTTGGLTLITSVPQFDIQDDTTALETPELYNYTLTSSSITKNVVLGAPAVFEILDDDVVRVSFDKSKYSYQENAGSVSGVTVKLSTTIARNLAIDVTGDPGVQLSTVDVSGTSFTVRVSFQARSNVLSPVSGATIKNDATALETVESYTYNLTNPSITDGVALGDDTEIEIIDDDDPSVSFVLPLYEYDEDHGDVTDIEIQLNTKILQDFTVTIAGDPGIQPSTVVISGFDVNGTVIFPANSVTGTKLKIPQKLEIRNDTTALETLETYHLSFTGSSVVSAILGRSTQIQIKDDDVASVVFATTLYEYNENDGAINNIEVVLNAPVAQDFTVDVTGGPGSQPSSVIVSGPNYNQNLTFVAHSSELKQTLSVLQLKDDEIAREQDEIYNITLSNPSHIDVMLINDDIATLKIKDNDVAKIGFTESTYTFNENDGVVNNKVRVKLDKEVAVPFKVRVYGDPGSPPSPIVNSGNLVDYEVTFGARVSPDQFVYVPVSITDDSASNEPMQKFTLAFKDKPSDVELTTTGTSEIVINDNDNSAVNFAEVEKTISESEGGANITVVLTRPIATTSQVTVVDDKGTFVRNVTFESLTPSQSHTIHFIYLDDVVALEDDKIFTYRLINPINVTIGDINTTQHIIKDDDPLNVTFGKSDYSFTEKDGTVSIQVQISNPVARNFTVEVKKLGGTSHFAHSGKGFEDTVVFAPTSPLSIPVVGLIVDDMFALEDIEVFDLVFRNPIPHPSQNDLIHIGSPTEVRITSEDVVSVTFANPVEDFDEYDEGTYPIVVKIDHAVAKTLTVNISCAYQTDPNVQKSGECPSNSVTFTTNGVMQENFGFSIDDDEIALENVEKHDLSFSGSNPPAGPGLILGPNTVVNVVDDDNVNVNFVKDSISISENESTVSVQVEIDKYVASDLIVNIQGGPDRAQQYVATSGTSVNENVKFNSTIGRIVSFTFNITDDNITLEDIETYQLSLFSFTIQPFTNATVTLGSPLDVQIIDDDILKVSFGATAYEFGEHEGIGRYSVVADKGRARDVTIQITGGPPSGIGISGTSVNRNIIFAKSNDHSEIDQLTFTINDDKVSLEDSEIYQLILTNPNPDPRVNLGNTTITIQDNDALQYSFIPKSKDLSENAGTRQFIFNVSPAAKQTTYRLTTNIPLHDEQSIVALNCTGQVGNTLTVLKSAVETNITCTVHIKDDNVALEDNESGNLTALVVSPSVPGAKPSTFTALIGDDDKPSVSFTTSSNSVLEGNDSMICVQVDKLSVYDITVTFETASGTAQGGSDYESTVSPAVIKANTKGPVCVAVHTYIDQAFEGDETFSTTIKDVSSASPSPINPGIGAMSSITTTIMDRSLSFIECKLDASSKLETFDKIDSYTYDKSCEHALLIEQVPTLGEFAIVLDSLDGTYEKSRMGVRLGQASVVVGVFNHTIISEQNLDSYNITVTASHDVLRIYPELLGVKIMIHKNGFEIRVEKNSRLSSFKGLCGNSTGNLVFRNGAAVDVSDSSSLDKALAQYLTPPSETFVRTVARKQCGILAEDIESGDPVYTVPLYTPNLPNPHTYSLCFEIHGDHQKYFNFISDGCTSVNGHYFAVDDPDDPYRDFHKVDQVHILAVNKNSKCVNISVTLESNNHCATKIGGVSTTSYNEYGVSIGVSGNTTTVTVPNCVDGALTMKITCKVTRRGFSYQEFRVIRGLNLREVSHGIIGQFWNVEANVTKYDTPLRDGTVSSNAYRVDLKPSNRPTQSFIGFLEQVTWDFADQQCIFAGNSQGGPIYEAADGEPNDSLLQGSYTDYKTDSAFDYTFPYGQFDESNKC